MKPQKNVSLIIGLSIPFLMIVLVAASITLPEFFAPKPQVNFLYVTGDDYYQGHAYVVDGGRLVKREVKYPEHYAPGVTRLFVHDVSANVSKEASFEEAQQLRLDSNSKSPDGYEVVYGNAEYGFFPLFFSGTRDYNSLYLKGHSASKRLNLQLPSDSRNYYSRNRARFLGWIR